jgi:hypothetical protein
MLRSGSLRFGWEEDYAPLPLVVFSMPADEGASVLLNAEDSKTQRGSNYYTINSKFLPGTEQKRSCDTAA